MLDYVLNGFEIEGIEKKEITEEVQKAGLKKITDIYLLVCCYKNENMIDRFFILENYIKAS